MEFILAVVGAFVFYLVVLPLFGWLVGFIFRVFLPYLSLGLIVCVLKANSSWYLLAALWILALIYIRRQALKRNEYHWTEGHYEAARTILTFGYADRRRAKKNGGLGKEASPSIQWD